MACSTFGNLERMRVPYPAPRPALIIAQCEPDPRPPHRRQDSMSLYPAVAYVIEQGLRRRDARCAGAFHVSLRLVNGRGVLARELEQPGRLGLEPRDGREVTGMVGGGGAERGALRQPMTAHHEIVAVLLHGLGLDARHDLVEVFQEFVRLALHRRGILPGYAWTDMPLLADLWLRF